MLQTGIRKSRIPSKGQSSTKSPAAFTGLKRLDHEDLLGGAAILGSPEQVQY